MREDDRLELAEGIHFQSFGDSEDGVLLSMESGYLYRCNGTALGLLKVIRDRPTWSELRTRLMAEFDVAEDQAVRDLERFVHHLRAEGLVSA